MSASLHELMEAGRLPALSYYFARFVARGAGAGDDSVLAASAALASLRNLAGDVCVDLGAYAGRPLVEDDGAAGPPAPRLPALAAWTAELAAAGWVGPPGAEAPLVLDGTRLYLGRYWRYEQQVAEALLQRMGIVEGLEPGRLRAPLARLFPPEADAVDWQKVAAAVAATRHFAVVSGGPGTGKTTTVVKLLALLAEQDPGLRIALAAPTGKAAARLTGAVRDGKLRLAGQVAPEILALVPEAAGTVHRLLGAGGNARFRHGRDHPLALDCLVVDEASMLDLTLMARLLEALPEAARLVLLGDRDQLASVAAGNVLGDITGHGRALHYSPDQARLLEAAGAAPAGALPVAADAPPAADAVGLLRVSYRFGGDSAIGRLARAVNAGEGARALALLAGGESADIAWLEAGDDALHPACVERAAARHAECLAQTDPAAALRALDRFRVLAALHRGPFGVTEINRRVAARLQGQGLIAGGEDYHGKPVLVTTNDYEVGLYNGDVGLLWRAPDGALRAWFPAGEGEPRSVSVRQLPEHVPAYALTVHKSQGSELDEVLLVLPAEASPLLTRELIYTGITRARRKVTVQGSPGAFVQGCRARVQRSSALAEKLGWPPPQ